MHLFSIHTQKKKKCHWCKGSKIRGFGKRNSWIKLLITFLFIFFSKMHHSWLKSSDIRMNFEAQNSNIYIYIKLNKFLISTRIGRRSKMSRNVCSVSQEEVLWWFPEKVDWVGLPILVSTVFQVDYSKLSPKSQPGHSYFSLQSQKKEENIE